jgi:hypothetical protein
MVAFAALIAAWKTPRSYSIEVSVRMKGAQKKG